MAKAWVRVWCKSCGKRYEVLVYVKDQPCPACERPLVPLRAKLSLAVPREESPDGQGNV